ncbi:MAG TPA: glycosyltransferase family 39 protein, partial [Candidatus Omnitrophota bacterium]|nr:glycosyltransferase family 39 protein [Candidatus Omnitrophota bacterium]
QAAYQRLIAQEPGRYIPEYLDKPLFKHPPVYCYLIALNYKMFGRGDLQAVSVSIILGSLMILAVFLLGAVLYDHRVGLLSAFLLCIDPVHWVCSERIWMETTLSFFMLLAILFFTLGQKQKFFFLFSGASIGLAILTKYPGALSLFVLFSFALAMERSLLKEKWFWALSGVSLLVFSPWFVWNWRVYGNLWDVFVSAHDLAYHWNSAINVISTHKIFVFGFFLLSGVFFFMRPMADFFWASRAEQRKGLKRKYFVILCSAALVFAVSAVPFLRAMIKEMFVWKSAIEVGWSNPFSLGPWHFYITRLAELSPFYVFSFMSFSLFFGKSRGDKLLVWSSFWILTAFILLGNYQSRYILPAVPFLIVLSARWQVLVYDRFSAVPTADGKDSPRAKKNLIFKILFFGMVLYFILKTLRAGLLIAIGPDFGYF